MKDIVLSLDRISKSYGAVKALTGVTFSIARGEIHTLLGENGAGKSTTLKIIKGEIAPDEGALVIDGHPVTEFDPANADKYGISMVHQELAVFENMSVAENVFIDRPPCRGGLIDAGSMNTHTAELLVLFGLDIDPRERLLHLTPGQRQIIEILRAINAQRKVLILDEPTSGLNARESEILLALLQRLRSQGQTIVFVSHRLGDVLQISDRITVLRDGAVIETLVNDGLTEGDLVARMVGRALSAVKHRPAAEARSHQPIVLEVAALGRNDAFEDVSFALHRGEIVGIYGLEGSGTSELSQALFGLIPVEAGTVSVAGEVVGDLNPLSMIRHGVSYLNSNRKDAGLFMSRSVADNVSASVLRQEARFGMIDEKKLMTRAASTIKRFAIRVTGADVPPQNLSGGNQQKVMLSASLAPDPSILIVNEPTRGIDVGAKAEVYRALTELADSGKSLIAFSSELPELLLLADRIMVMRSRTISGWLTGTAMTEERVMALAAGTA